MAGVCEKLSRTQKLATFLIVIGPEAAAHVLKQFEDEEIELICREMTAITAIEEEDQQKAIDEFSGVILSSYGSLLGGRSTRERLLRLRKGISRLRVFSNASLLPATRLR